MHRTTNFSFPKFSTGVAAILCVSMLGLAPVSLSAAQGADGGNERINFSGKLRMLSQRVAASACNYNAGVAKEDSLAVLSGAQTEFNKITRALEHGDAELRMNGAETRRKTLHALENLHGEWDTIDAAVDNIVGGNDVQQNVGVISEHNMALLSQAKLLVSEISGQYSNPIEMVQADALLIDFAGRQRMLTQKMSKESCEAWSGDAAASEALAGTMNMYEASLAALLGGMAAAGIRPPPTEEIRSSLDDIWSDWSELKPELENAVANVPASPEHRSDVFTKLNVMLVEMNEVVGLYTKFVKSAR